MFTSNAFAILGLRALYFLLAGMIRRFTDLKLGLAVVLVFVGVKMLLTDNYKIPIWTSLGVIATVLAIAMTLSWRKTSRDEANPEAELLAPPLEDAVPVPESIR